MRNCKVSGDYIGGPGGALAPKKPCLTKSPKPKPPPAEFQSENRHIIPGIRLSRIPVSPKDLPGLEYNQFDAKKPRQDSSIKKPANNRKKRSFLQLLHKAVGKTGVTRRKSSPLPYLCLLLKKQVLPLFKSAVSFAFQKPHQDSSIKNRQTIAKSAAFCGFGTGHLYKA